ncbi:MAG: hypothetical protein OXF02_02905 [Simkaniaceae bacterium]|nr:hypothetical protein [Simkaniaceae bacterium]
METESPTSTIHGRIMIAGAETAPEDIIAPEDSALWSDLSFTVNNIAQPVIEDSGCYRLNTRDTVFGCAVATEVFVGAGALLASAFGGGYVAATMGGTAWTIAGGSLLGVLSAYCPVGGAVLLTMYCWSGC